MGKSKHTLGPWRHGFSHSEHLAEITTEDNTKRLARVDCHTFEQCQADARLIAAAPELLDCLQHLVDNCIRNSDGSLNLGTYEITMMERVITKAEGKSK